MDANFQKVPHIINPRKKTIWQTMVQQKWLIVMSLPVLLYVLLFNYAPMWGWLIGFLKYEPDNGITGSQYVGLDHFVWLFGRDDFVRTIRNTLAMSLINLTFGTVSSIGLAVLLNEVRHRSFKRTVQTVTYLPHFLSMVIVVGMAQNIFASDGPVNRLCMSLGIMKEPVFWLGEPEHFWWLQGIINVWKEVGWNTIIYISAMTSIDPCLYEAASIDGAGRFNRILHVTLPGIKATFVILMIMNIGHLMEAGFEIQYLMGNSLIREYSETIDVFVMRYGLGMQQPNYSLATAAGIFKSIVAIFLLFGANTISRKMGEDSLI